MAAVHGVTCQEELGGSPHKPQGIFASRVNYHAFLNRFSASDNRFILPFYLHKAEAT